MAKGKKKSKDLDFQKVKLKVGRKLKRDTNETKAEFKSRKIILKEVKSYSEDPITALSRHSDHISHHGKLTMLNHFNSAMTPDVVSSLNKPILDSLSKFIVDHSEQVRSAATKCLKTCYNQMKRLHVPTCDYMLSLKPYLNCAYTHVSRPISTDCEKLLSYFVSLNDPQLFEPLMSIILRRYEAGSLSESDRHLAIKLRRYYLRSKQKEVVAEILRDDNIKPLNWSETCCFFDVDSLRHNLGSQFDSSREVSLVGEEEFEDICTRYLEMVQDNDEIIPERVSAKNESRPWPKVDEFNPLVNPQKRRRFT